MWLISQIGFFSIVQKPEDARSGTLTVRSRVRSDLDVLRKKYLPTLGATTVDAGTDYKYRAKAPRGEVSKAVAALVADVEYGNFKNAVTKGQGAVRASVYHEVWTVLNKLKDDETRVRGRTTFAVPKADAYGGVLIDADGRVLLREPTNHFGGYQWTFPKGKPDKGEAPPEAALREVREETGYNAQIVGALPKAYIGSTSTTAFFLMKPDGKQGRFHEETNATRWVTFSEARRLVAKNKKPGNLRDQEILDDAERMTKSDR